MKTVLRVTNGQDIIGEYVSKENAEHRVMDENDEIKRLIDEGREVDRPLYYIV